MTKSNLIDLLKEIQALEKHAQRGYDVVDDRFIDPFHSLIDHLLQYIFTKSGHEMVCWWLYDDVEKVLYFKDKYRHKKTIKVKSPEEFANYIWNERKLYIRNPDETVEKKPATMKSKTPEFMDPNAKNIFECLLGSKKKR